MQATVAMDRLLCGAAALGLIWMLGPLLMASLRLHLVRVSVLEDPESVEPRVGDMSYRTRFLQFANLGYRPLGTTLETVWFNTPLRWVRRTLQGERWLAAPDNRTFVEMHRIVPEEPVRFGAVTLFEGGGMLRTTSPGAGLSGDLGPRYRRHEVQNVDAADLVGRHQRNVAAFVQELGLVVKTATLPEVAAEDAAASRLTLGRQKVRGYWQLVLAVCAVPALGFVLMLFTPGRQDRHLHDLAISALAATAMYAVVRHHLLTVELRNRALKRHGVTR
jgi:hypothetical protein